MLLYKTTPAALSGPVEVETGVPVLLCEDRRILLDTGSPVSMGRLPEGLDRLRGEAKGSPFGGLLPVDAVLDAVREHIDPRIDAIAGSDVLAEHAVELDWEAGTYAFGTGMGSGGVPLRLVAGVPTVSARIDLLRPRCFVDTGAARTFVMPHIVAREPTGRHEDFYPLLGRFTAPTRRVRAGLGRMRADLEVAALPEPMATMLRLLGVEGIIGMDAIGPERVGRAVIDLAGGRLILDDQIGA